MINAKNAKSIAFEALRRRAKEIITNEIEPKISKTASLGDFSCVYNMEKVGHPSEVAKIIIDELHACGYNAKYGVDRYSEFDLEINWKDECDV
jgi:hypothetical protein